MKALLLPILPLALLTISASAQTTVKSRKSTVVEERASTNLYRSIPRGNGLGDPNKQRTRTVAFKPTQHFYTRDSVISYRYGAELTYSGAVEAGGYLGPHGAVFSPEGDEVPASAAIRNFASVNRRTQPGVGMAPNSSTAVRKTTVTRIAAPESKVALK